jgi:hypothetical protein
VLFIVALYSKYARALTFENMRIGVMSGGKPREVVLNPLAKTLWDSLQALKVWMLKETYNASKRDL